MKRIIFILLSLLIVSPVFAKNIKVEAVSDFSTVNPPKTWQVKVLEDFVMKDGFVVHSGAIIDGKVDKVKNQQKIEENLISYKLMFQENILLKLL
mgnify:CR=1 FL=1